MGRTFVGFGFGSIQSGLFLLEAFRAGTFSRLVVAEVDEHIIDAIESAGGKYYVNVAEADRVVSYCVDGLELYDPRTTNGHARLIAAIAESEEIATALPSVDYYDRGSPSPADLLAAGFSEKFSRQTSSPTIVYTAENNNHAAEALRSQVIGDLSVPRQAALSEKVQFINTVIGKMSGIVTDQQQIESAGLQPLSSHVSRAVLVEAFSKILIEKIELPGFQRGLHAFQEKPDLLPFEEAKLYGHNAAHALMGFLAHQQRMEFMSQVRGTELYELVGGAFLKESGVSLCRRHEGVDNLFTEAGWQLYTGDLLRRMTNPFLSDRVDRVIRDPRRKLGWDDRFIGTMRLALENGVQPSVYAKGAAAAVIELSKQGEGEAPDSILESIGTEQQCSAEMRSAVLDLIRKELA